MAQYPASYPQTIRLEAPTLPSTVSCRLSATGIRFSVILFPPRDWALLTVGLPTPATGWDLDGVTAFRTHERRPGWVPSIPRGRRCSSPGTDGVSARRLPRYHGTSLSPRSNIPSREALLHEASTKVQAIHPSDLPLTRRRPDGTSSSFGFPPSFAPRRPGAGQRTSGRGQAN
jgi:hypothetical protein